MGVASIETALGRDGTQMKSVDGKPQWAQLILFTSRELRDRWSKAALTALRTSHPHALDE